MIKVKREEPITKKEFIEEVLTNTLHHAEIGVKSLELTKDENRVYIKYDSGFERRVDITGDDHASIIMAVTRVAMY
ncbi:hypothetical protein HNQ56_003775 [Anaerotaenia torta]|uniref:hypothetical protein n=1 Tax=Anaerotaenia torta TaxID=433293 RepID=UPI003D19FCA9